MPNTAYPVSVSDVQQDESVLPPVNRGSLTHLELRLLHCTNLRCPCVQVRFRRRRVREGASRIMHCSGVLDEALGMRVRARVRWILRSREMTATKNACLGMIPERCTCSDSPRADSWLITISVPLRRKLRLPWNIRLRMLTTPNPSITVVVYGVSMRPQRFTSSLLSLHDVIKVTPFNHDGHHRAAFKPKQTTIKILMNQDQFTRTCCTVLHGATRAESVSRVLPPGFSRNFRPSDRSMGNALNSRDSGS